MKRLLLATLALVWIGSASAQVTQQAIGSINGKRGANVSLSAADVGAMSCPGSGSCASIAAFLPALQMLEASTVPDVTSDLETSLPAGTPAALEWRSGQITSGGALAAFIAARYGIPPIGAASMASLFTQAGAAVANGGQLARYTAPTLAQLGGVAAVNGAATGLQLTGGTVSGQTGDVSAESVTATGAVASRVHSAREHDRATCRDFGCIFDGGHHPLSSIRSYNEASVVGWTLAQWQGIYPDATALTDEIDGLAVQRIVDGGPDAYSTVIVRLPPGLGFASHPIATCATSLRVEGAGSYASQLSFLPGVDGFRHCYGQTTGVTGTSVELIGVLLTTEALNAAAVAGTFQNCGNWCVKLTDVSMHGESNYGNNAAGSIPMAWRNCLNINNPEGMILRDVTCVGSLSGPLTQVDDGFVLTALPVNGAASAPVFDQQFYGVNINGYNTCETFHSTGAGQGIEGVVQHGLQCGAVNRCITILTDRATYAPPQYFFDDMECESSAQLVYVQGASYGHVKNSLFYVNPQTANTGYLGPSDLFTLGQSVNWEIEGNAVELLPGSTAHSVFALTPSAAHTNILHNKVQFDTFASPAPTLTSAGIIDAASASSGYINAYNVERDTDWQYFPSGAVLAANGNADPHTYLESQVKYGVTYARLPPLGDNSKPLIWCTDCRKPGQGANAGDGMRVFDDGARWIDTAGNVATH